MSCHWISTEDIISDSPIRSWGSAFVYSHSSFKLQPFNIAHKNKWAYWFWYDTWILQNCGKDGSFFFLQGSATDIDTNWKKINTISQEKWDIIFCEFQILDIFSQVQCHSYTGYCWCVTPNGRPISGTAVAHKTPRCPGNYISIIVAEAVLPFPYFLSWYTESKYPETEANLPN